MADRTCTVRGNGGPLVVRLTADNLLNSGARFILVDSTDTIRSNWTMQTGDDGRDEHRITEFAPSALAGFYIKWLIRTCSRHPSAESGTIRVEVFQDGVAAPMSPLASWTQKVPQCSTGTAFRITDFCDLVIQ
jgi:hypothetical protein